MPRDGDDVSPTYGLSQRARPMNLQAEAALLGGLLANNRSFERVVDFLRPEHFAYEQHASVYRAIESRIVEGRLADAVTLSQDFENAGILDDVGGTAYLAQLLAAMVGINTIGEYARAIHDCWVRRQLIDVGEQVINDAFSSAVELTGNQQIEQAERALADLASNGRRRGSVLVSFRDALNAVVAKANEAYRTGESGMLRTGIASFDQATSGLWPAELILLAGVPGSGKTALAMQVAINVAATLQMQYLGAGRSLRDIPRVLFLSREMSPEQLAARVAAQQIGISAERLLRGDLDLAMAAAMAQRIGSIQDLPLDIQDCRATPLKLVGARARMLLQRQPTSLVILDHLLVADPEVAGAKSRNSGGDAANVSAAAYAQKDIAAEFGVPYLVLSQMSRPPREGGVRRPTMQSLKYGGEDAADTILFVHRPIMFMDDTEPTRGAKEGEEAFATRANRWRISREQAEDVAELVVTKRRMGSTGVWRMRWDGPSTSFSEWTAEVSAAEMEGPF